MPEEQCRARRLRPNAAPVSAVQPLRRGEVALIGETEKYLANNLDEQRAGCYYLGKRILIDLESFEADSYIYRANKLHLVVDLDTKVTLRISGHKPD